MKLCLPQILKLVQGAKPETTNGGKTAAYISCKTLQRVTVLISLIQAVGHATAFTLRKAQAIAGTGAADLGVAVPTWVNEDTGASDTMVRQADGYAYTVANDVKNKLIAFQLDGDILAGIGGGMDCLTVIAANSGQATNLWSVTYLCETKYPGDSSPSVIVD